MEKIELILKHDVPHLGSTGELVAVRPGYGRNFLIPQGLAVTATRNNKARIEHERRLIEKEALARRQDAEASLTKLKGVTVQFARRTGEGDKLFGSVTSKDIEESLAQKGVKVDRKKIVLAEPIKALGIYTVEVRLGADLVGSIQVQVVAA